MSLLTGYALAMAIIGGAVFVDRVLYGGPDEQRLALGALAGATALGALLSGFAVRIASFRVVTLVGLAAAVVGLAGDVPLDAGHDDRRGGHGPGAIRAGLRAVGHAALGGGGRGGRSRRRSARRRRS